MKTTKKALDALDRSIKEKWLPLSLGKGEDHGVANCQLCRIFMDGDRDCGSCPVAKDGHVACDRTPYVNWSNACEAGGQGFPFVANTPQLRALAKKELQYLRDLKRRLLAQNAKQERKRK